METKIDLKLKETITKCIDDRASELMAEETPFNAGMAAILTAVGSVFADGISNMGRVAKMDREAYIVYIDAIVKLFRKEALKQYVPEIK